jgi:cbb3-type cytochrome oxidase subunit 3
VNAVITFLSVWAIVILLLLTMAWTRWWWRLRRRQRARMAKRSIDRAERALYG